jgi:hypothetical protein
MSNSAFIRRGSGTIHSSGIIIAVSLGLLFTGCDEEPTRHTAEVPDVTGAGPASSSATLATASTMNLPLPFSGTVSSSGPAFYIIQQGIGINAKFENNGTTSAGPALYASTRAQGTALHAQNNGTGGRAANIISAHAANTRVALEVGSWSTGANSDATAVLVNANNTNATVPTVTVNTLGKGPLLKVNHKGTAGDLAIFQTASANKIRFSRTGRGYFNGGTQLGGADLAEAFEVEGGVKGYEPGDVLTISETNDRTVKKSDEPYSTRVVGVYATKPGVLLTERDINANLDDMVPLGIVGVIPTKVSAENGAIRRGDLLVTARASGHAMAADPRRLQFGMVLGKALEAFPGPGTGTIRVLVNVK